MERTCYSEASFPTALDARAEGMLLSTLACQQAVKHCANPNCLTEHEKTWRRVHGDSYCNACAVYYKDHGRQRPLHLVQRSLRRSASVNVEAAASKSQLTASPSRSRTLSTSAQQSAPGSPAVRDCMRQDSMNMAPQRIRTQRSSSNEDEDYVPALCAHARARYGAPPKRSGRSRSQLRSFDDFIGVPESPVSSEDCLTAFHPGDAACIATDEDATAALLTMRSDLHGWGQYMHTEMEHQRRRQQQAQSKPSVPRKRKAADAQGLVGGQADEKRCSNCGTTDNTGKAWRRFEGALMCNACGVYPKQKEHLGEMRPISCIEKAARKMKHLKVKHEPAAPTTAPASPLVPEADTPKEADEIEAFYEAPVSPSLPSIQALPVPDGQAHSARVQVVLTSSQPLLSSIAALVSPPRWSCNLQVHHSSHAHVATAAPISRSLFGCKPRM